MTLHEIRNVLASISEGTGNTIEMSPEQYNLYLGMSLYDVLKMKFGFSKDSVGAETDIAIIDALKKYKTSAQITLTAGVGSLPADYMRLLPKSCVNISGTTYTPVEYVTEEVYTYRKGHSIIPPAASYPVCRIIGSSIYLDPVLTTINIVYYKRPATPVYAFTETNGIVTYDSGNSTELEIDDEYHIDIIRTILEYMHIPMTNENIQTYLKQKKIEEN